MFQEVLVVWLCELFGNINILKFFVVLYIVCFMSSCVLFVCKCVLNYCYRVATQLQLINISLSIFNINNL
jgi:hypothetical protein